MQALMASATASGHSPGMWGSLMRPRRGTSSVTSSCTHSNVHRVRSYRGTTPSQTWVGWGGQGCCHMIIHILYYHNVTPQSGLGGLGRQGCCSRLLYRQGGVQEQRQRVVELATASRTLVHASSLISAFISSALQRPPRKATYPQHHAQAEDIALLSTLLSQKHLRACARAAAIQ
jgi:hypothetical protein